MRKGDRIVEVNGTRVLSLSHAEVVQKIKSDPKQVTMLLVDPEAEKYFTAKNVVLSGDLPNVLEIICPNTKPVPGEPIKKN